MTRIRLALLVLTLAILACGQYITPTPTPNALGTATNAPTHTPAATRALTASATKEAQTAQVVAPVVNVRRSSGGDVVGQIYAGQDVVILSCAENWCQIKEPLGFVWQGCLSENPDDLGCEAK